MSKTYYIYKIVCKNENVKEFYVGSTINVIKRKHNHKSSCNNEKDHNHNEKKYKFIRENGGWDNFDFIIVEEIPNHTKIQACIREQYWINDIKQSLNSKPAYVSKEDIKQNQLNFKKKYNKITVNCCCGSISLLDKLARHKQSKNHIEYIEAQSKDLI
jgi:predicted GIY-YIG superfamily endonuclease